MTKEETMRIIDLIANTYPNFKVTDGVIQTWMSFLKDENFQDFHRAFVFTAKNSESPFPPSIGQIRSKLPKLELPESLRWTPEEALINHLSSKLLIRDARNFADKVVPAVQGNRQFFSIEEMHKENQINERMWERSFKDRFKETQGAALALIATGLDHKLAILRIIEQRGFIAISDNTQIPQIENMIEDLSNKMSIGKTI